ncbi:methyl- -binding domain-containing 9 [Olea europaea subsp. europaea]|uniref:Methyl- -binding domain-containing 9 n=1 Tax=Olea europaea subsp. europaea TaxID=158383 RepID=A0A8S0T966_OLEEU|nr:methyl- -binding domain-containing 9 [Olea europaea subsp. europaea]
MYAMQSEEYCPPSDPSLSMDASELVSNQEVLKLVRNEIQILKNSMTNLKTELKMRSLRTEFLGVDSAQRLYWIMELVEHPQIIVAEGISQDYKRRCSGKNFVPIGNKDRSSARGSEARCPIYEDGYRNATLSSWMEIVAECKMYRCTCLKPIPPTADHCLICNKTSFDKIEIKEHNPKCVVPPASSSKPVICKASHVLRQLKISLLDMYAALPEEALRSSKARFDRRCAWRAFMVLASIALEDMVKSEYLNKKWWSGPHLQLRQRFQPCPLYLCEYTPWMPLSFTRKFLLFRPHSSPTANQMVRKGKMIRASTGKLARRVNRKRKEPEV